MDSYSLQYIIESSKRITNLVHSFVKKNPEVVIYGDERDLSTYYLSSNSNHKYRDLAYRLNSMGIYSLRGRKTKFDIDSCRKYPAGVCAPKDTLRISLLYMYCFVNTVNRDAIFYCFSHELGHLHDPYIREFTEFKKEYLSRRCEIFATACAVSSYIIRNKLPVEHIPKVMKRFWYRPGIDFSDKLIKKYTTSALRLLKKSGYTE